MASKIQESALLHAPTPVFAHSLSDKTENEWEHLADHLSLVGEKAAKFASHFGAGTWGDVAGRLHDIGKMSAGFQAYIKGNGALKGPDHATAGAQEADRLYGVGVGRILAYCIAGHHAGLADGGTEHLPGTLSHRLLKPLCGDRWSVRGGIKLDFAGHGGMGPENSGFSGL
jgi:CRISPR-associated endonuclease/helicase Cas3